MSKLPMPFDNPYTYTGHSGVDYPQPKGTPFRASGPGYVASLDYAPRPGFTVWVKYDDGPLVGYAHMDQRTEDVTRGLRVEEGTILGRVGKTGTFSTGYHLHSEISGNATTAGYWRYFDRNKVVGQGSGSGGGSNPFPTLTPEEGFLMALAPAQQAQLYDANVRHSAAGDYYTNDAILNDLRTYGDGLVARIDAANTRLDAVLAKLEALESNG